LFHPAYASITGQPFAIFVCPSFLLLADPGDRHHIIVHEMLHLKGMTDHGVIDGLVSEHCPASEA